MPFQNCANDDDAVVRFMVFREHSVRRGELIVAFDFLYVEGMYFISSIYHFNLQPEKCLEWICSYARNIAAQWVISGMRGG